MYAVGCACNPTEPIPTSSLCSGPSRCIFRLAACVWVIRVSLFRIFFAEFSSKLGFSGWFFPGCFPLGIQKVQRFGIPSGKKGLAKNHSENDSYEKGCNKKTVKNIASTDARARRSMRSDETTQTYILFYVSASDCSILFTLNIHMPEGVSTWRQIPQYEGQAIQRIKRTQANKSHHCPTIRRPMRHQCCHENTNTPCNEAKQENLHKVRSGAKECKSCRSRKMLQNEPLVAIVAVDTAENEPLKVWAVSFQFFIPLLNHERSTGPSLSYRGLSKARKKKWQ